LRHPGELERGRAEPEHRDHEDRRHPAEEVGVDDRHRAQREEDGPGEAADHREEKGEDEDERLRDAEDLHVEQERVGDLAERRPERAPVEEGLLALGPAGRLGDDAPGDDEEDDRAERRDEPAAAAAAGPPPAEDLRAAGLYFRTGAPVAFASHCCWIFFSVPLAFRAASARSTHPTSGLPLANTIPKCSPPPSVGNWPRIFEFGTCTAVT